jgi:hypothetical protein
LSGLKRLTSDQQNLSVGEIKFSRGPRKGLQGLMRVLAWRMNLTSGKSKGMGPETGFLGSVQGLNAPRQRNPVSKFKVSVLLNQISEFCKNSEI